MRTRALFAVLLTATFTVSAHADDAADAKRLFEEGRKALAEGRVGPACESFAEAKRLAPDACGVVQNLAMCRQQQGRYADAYDEYDALTSCATKANQADRVKYAEDQRATLRGKLASLTLVPGAGPKIVSVYVDGASLELPFEGKARVLEPGRHRIEVEREGCSTERFDVALQAGNTQSLLLPTTCGAQASTQTTKTEPAPAPTPPPSGPPPAVPISTPTRWQIPVGWTAVTVGGLAAISSLAPCGLIVIGQRDNDESEKARSTATVCTAVGVAGGAVLVTGIVLLLTAPSKPKPVSTTYGVAPYVAGARDMGIGAYLRF